MKRIGFSTLALFGVATAATVVASDGPPAHYKQIDLVSNIPGLAVSTDARLVNPWGLARSATSPWWVADNGTGLSTLYTGTGAPQSLVVTIPAAPGGPDPAVPTGTVFNGVATDFLVGPGQPARFLFATEDGRIAGWNSGSTAVIMVNNAGAASYKGLTLGQVGTANFLFAANFAGGTVDVFNNAFAPVTPAAGAFQDPKIPAGYSPFNVQNIGGKIYVTFAKHEGNSLDETDGPGKGFVDVFSTSGVLQLRLDPGAWFNAPWGVAVAPADFGPLSNMILVGQFGSGKIAAFDPVSGKFQGMMRNGRGNAIVIKGLWALGFGNGASAGPTNSLFFTAGIDDEANGLFGLLNALATKDRDRGPDEGESESEDED